VLERTIYPASKHEAALGSIERAPAAQPTVLYLGRITTAKGIEVAYRALAALRREHGIDARLVQVGTAKPEMAATLQRLAAELDLTVDDRGQLDTDELAPVLAQAGVLLLPTVEWEAFGLVIVEAGLARVPIVAARIGGVPEIVTDGEHALLFEPGDVSGCAAALAAVFGEPEATAERSRRAHERMGRFSIARYRAESEQFLTDAAEALS
jgi:glycosyltransferase involved in cell wall biosynthesis